MGEQWFNEKQKNENNIGKFFIIVQSRWMVTLLAQSVKIHH